jgi:hypothetical protein
LVLASHGVAEMIAVAVPHHDQVDLAALAEILERVGQLGRALIQGSIMMTLPPGLAVFQGGSCRFSVSA